MYGWRENLFSKFQVYSIKSFISHSNICWSVLSCVRLFRPMDYSTAGFPVHHQLPELTYRPRYEVHHCFFCFPVYLLWSNWTRWHDLHVLEGWFLSQLFQIPLSPSTKESKMQYLYAFSKMTMISVRFQGKPFNITVIQV